MMHFKRIRGGYYEARAVAPFEKDGVVSEREVTVYVRHMPEWSGSEKWAVTMEIEHADRAPESVVNLTDVIARSFAEAKEYAEACVRGGFRYYTHLRWCAR